MILPAVRERRAHVMHLIAVVPIFNSDATKIKRYDERNV